MQEVRVVRAEPFPDLDDEVVYPRLSEAKLQWLEKKKGGERRSFEPGDVLYEHAVRDAPFFVLLSGKVEFVDRKPGKDVHIAAADAGTYIGDIAAFTGEPTISAVVAVEPTEALVFEREALREMVAAWPEFGEQVFRTLLARRAWHEEHGYGVMRLIAPQASRRAFEVRDLLERNLLPVHWYDVDNDPESTEMLSWLEIPREETPVLVHARDVLRNPSPAQVARSLGLRAEVDGERFDLVVLGAGPAGLAAAGYGGAGRPGRDEHQDRELPRLPDRDRRPRADDQGDAAGAPLRRRAVELPPRGRTRRRTGRAGADRPRRRPTRAGALAGDGDRRALARAARRGHGPLPRRRRLPRRDADRCPAGARQRRDRDRRRQLRRPGGDRPLQTCAQRARGRPRDGAEVDDVALPGRPGGTLAADRGDDRNRGRRP